MTATAANSPRTPGIAPGRLDAATLAANFADAAPPLDPHEALVAADRRYFCDDAPCVAACPTAIDIPLFIRQIATGATEAAARTILSQNILGGMCARVCPTETLCERACVREAAEGAPVRIGALQRFATDALMATGEHPFARAAPTARRIAVVGAGPAGLACAHWLAMRGHEVTLYDARPKAGGLNENGFAADKAPGGFAQTELDWLLRIGGITVETGRRLGADLSLDELRRDVDAVFLGIGLAGVNALKAAGATTAGVRAAVDVIAELRQADDVGAVPVGRRVVVIGGGMTAIGAAAQAKLLGAEQATIVYRRGPARMSASRAEPEHAKSLGVRILAGAAPRRVKGRGAAQAVAFACTQDGPEGLVETEETFTLEADLVLCAIGQTLDGAPEGLRLEGGKIAVDARGRTSLTGVQAGGDCATGGEDRTVTAVAQGRDAAEDIHATLTGERAMPYVDGFVAAVPTANRDVYRAHAERAAAIFREYGALRLVECWGDDVPEGALTSFPMAVKRAPDETVVFSWIVWPDKATRDAGHARMREDPRLRDEPTPFDGARMIYGGFEMIVDA